MNYQYVYDNIIKKAKSEDRDKNEAYYEEHHILPKCLNGSNDVNNLVLLTAKEHFICHKLLTYINPNNKKIVYAFHMMCCMKDRHKRDYKVSGRDYAYLRELINKNGGPTRGMKMQPLSSNHKNKISERMINHSVSGDTIAKMQEGRRIRFKRIKNEKIYNSVIHPKVKMKIMKDFDDERIKHNEYQKERRHLLGISIKYIKTTPTTFE